MKKLNLILYWMQIALIIASTIVLRATTVPAWDYSALAVLGLMTMTSVWHHANNRKLIYTDVHFAFRMFLLNCLLIFVGIGLIVKSSDSLEALIGLCYILGGYAWYYMTDRTFLILIKGWRLSLYLNTPMTATERLKHQDVCEN